MRSTSLLLPALLALLAACGRDPSPASSAAPPSVSPGVVFRPTRQDLGAVHAGRAIDVPFPWRRTGDGPVRVLASRSDCGCAALTGMAGTLQAGESGALTLRLAPRRRPGPFRVRARIYTDAPSPADRIVLVARGFVGVPLAFRPPALALGSRSPGARLRRTVEVRWDPAAIPEGAPAATLTGLAGTARLELAARAAGASGGSSDEAGRLLRLDLRLPRRLGPFEGQVVLKLGNRLLGTLPVSGEMCGTAGGEVPARLPRSRGSPDPVPPR